MFCACRRAWAGGASAKAASNRLCVLDPLRGPLCLVVVTGGPAPAPVSFFVKEPTEEGKGRGKAEGPLGVIQFHVSLIRSLGRRYPDKKGKQRSVIRFFFRAL